MHDQPTCGPALSEAEIQDEMQIAVLRFLLDPRPAPLTLEEVLTSSSGSTTGRSASETGFGTRCETLRAQAWRTVMVSSSCRPERPCGSVSLPGPNRADARERRRRAERSGGQSRRVPAVYAAVDHVVDTAVDDVVDAAIAHGARDLRVG